jgi:hypothetical protein
VTPFKAIAAGLVFVALMVGVILLIAKWAFIGIVVAAVLVIGALAVVSMSVRGKSKDDPPRDWHEA